MICHMWKPEVATWLFRMSGLKVCFLVEQVCTLLLGLSLLGLRGTKIVVIGCATWQRGTPKNGFWWISAMLSYPWGSWHIMTFVYIMSQYISTVYMIYMQRYIYIYKDMRVDPSIDLWQVTQRPYRIFLGHTGASSLPWHPPCALAEPVATHLSISKHMGLSENRIYSQL